MKAVALAALPVAAALCSNALASSYYYNPALSGTGSADEWGDANWSMSTSTGYNSTWSDGNDAIFTGSQTVVVDNNYAPNSIQDNSATSGTLTFTNAGNSASGAVYTLTTSTIETSTSSTITVENVSLGGSALTFEGEGSTDRPQLNFSANNPNVTPYVGTITFNTAVGTWNLSTTAIALSGSQTNAVISGTGLYIVPSYSVTMGSISQTAPTGQNDQIFTSGSLDPTLTITQSSNQAFSGTFTGGHAMTFAKAGPSTLTFTGSQAFNNGFTSVVVQAGNLQIGNTNVYTQTTGFTYVPVTIDNGGTLSSSGSYDLVGNSNTYSTSTGNFTGNNTNGFSITTEGTTAYIAPSGKFGITTLNAANGAALAFSAGNDLLSLYTLIGTSSDGTFVIDCSGLTSPVAGTPYTVMQWVAGTDVDGSDFGVIDPSGYNATLTLNSNNLQVTFSIVPEPASISFLLAGMPLLLRRRRRGFFHGTHTAN